MRWAVPARSQGRPKARPSVVVSPAAAWSSVALPSTALLDPTIDLVILTGPAGCGKTGITSTIISIFVQTSVKIKSIAQFLQRNIIKNFSFTNQIKTPSKLFLGECYV